MNFFAKYKNITMVVVIAGLVYLGYSYFFGGVESDSDLISQNVGVAEGGAVGADLLRTLLTLRSLTLDEKIFSDTVFLSLKDFSQPITPLPVGRPNPFAPFAGSVSSGGAKPR
jgi:hypothetical protein